MKVILIFAFLSTCCCLEIVKDAKPAVENPKIGRKIRNLYPEVNLKENKPIRRGKIVRGNAAELGQFKHQTLLNMNDQDGWYLCGGSFVRYNWVLSAGHCVNGFDVIYVFGGLTNYETGPVNYAALVDNPSHMITHEGYDPDTLENDIGMIFIKNSTADVFEKFKSYLGVINLPNFNDALINLNGRDAVISGFGRINNYEDSSILRWAETSIISNNICGIFFWGLIKDSNICISTVRGKSTCQGDSGGPLTVEINSNKTIVGITSFVSNFGCTYRLPAGFTRVTYYLNWINDQFNKLT